MRAVWDALISWLNQNSGAAQAMLTAGLMLFAAWQGVLAWSARNNAKRLAEAAKEQAEEMREQRIFATQPIIAVVPGGSTNSSVTLKLRNVGRGPAFNVRCVVKHPAFDMPGKNVTAYPLAAGEDTGWVSVSADAGESEYRESPIEVTYQDQYGRAMISRFRGGILETDVAGVRHDP